MLKGVATPGPAFRLDPVRAAYAPTPGVHLHSSSHGAARALLGRFAEAATAVRRVQAFCAAAAAGGSVAAAAAAASEEAAAEQRRLYALPTVAAFAAAVAEQQQGLQRQVLILEAAAASGALSSLLQLQQRTAGLAQQAALLAALARRCCVWRGSPAETAAGLLSGLYEALQLQLAQARSEGEAGVHRALAVGGDENNQLPVKLPSAAPPCISHGLSAPPALSPAVPAAPQAACWPRCCCGCSPPPAARCWPPCTPGCTADSWTTRQQSSSCRPAVRCVAQAVLRTCLFSKLGRGLGESAGWAHA